MHRHSRPYSVRHVSYLVRSRLSGADTFFAVLAFLAVSCAAAASEREPAGAKAPAYMRSGAGAREPTRRPELPPSREAGSEAPAYVRLKAPVDDRSTVAADPLRQASGSIEALVSRVSASVVQVLVTGYRPVSDGSGRTDVAMGRGRAVGSGTVIDAAGYILTNAHVVAGAERIEVILPEAPSDGPPRLGSLAIRSRQARLVGVANELDLALLVVDGPGLRALPIADYDTLRQGELVFAFGSPDGLRNSVTMGMVSSVARQVEPNSPLVYIQTDAAINPGNSGGPLVNAKGEIVGINTFIRSVSGGSEGLGFALPSALVAIAYPQLRDFGHLHRALIGLAVQGVTPNLAAGLSLPPDARLIVADVAPGSPASRTGLKPGDILRAIDGRPIEDMTLAGLYLSLYTLRDGQTVALEATRGDQRFIAKPMAEAIPHVCERTAMLDVAGTLVEPLGILGLEMNAEVAASMPGLRARSGVVVTALIDGPNAPRGLLERGDVIHEINGSPVATPTDLREALGHGAAPPVVLQVERNGQLTYVALDSATQ
jgi:serine protease Do